MGNQDPLWQEWLKWATARGAICGEGAKGTWQPRYMVDDRDGVWTVKTADPEDGTVGKPIAVPAVSAAKVVEVTVDEEPLDNWEDLESDEEEPPAATPSAGSKAVAADD